MPSVDLVFFLLNRYAYDATIILTPIKMLHDHYIYVFYETLSFDKPTFIMSNSFSKHNIDIDRDYKIINYNMPTTRFGPCSLQKEHIHRIHVRASPLTNGATMRYRCGIDVIPLISDSISIYIIIYKASIVT